MKRLFYILLILGLVGGVVYSVRPPGNLAVVEIVGGIYEAEPLTRLLRDLGQEKNIKAVVLRIDSPGGSVGAAQEILDSVAKLSKLRPVVASFGNVAASGGYYIALPAQKIVANPGTITGSIGVRMEYVNLEELLGWVKVRSETLKSGRWKDVGSPTRPMDPEERAYLESLLGKLHQQFKTAVATWRHLTPEKVEELAQGQIFTGEEGKEVGLVDEIGSLDDAIAIAAKLGGISGSPEIFYPEGRYRHFMERIFGKALDSLMRSVVKTIHPGFRAYY